ncbi:hypothetical protein V2J09_013162 [Rumex salicifolius]
MEGDDDILAAYKYRCKVKFYAVAKAVSGCTSTKHDGGSNHEKDQSHSLSLGYGLRGRVREGLVDKRQHRGDEKKYKSAFPHIAGELFGKNIENGTHRKGEEWWSEYAQGNI